MPLFRLRVIADQVTDLPQDRVSWGWGIECAAAPESGDLAPLFEGFELAMNTGAAANLKLLAYVAGDLTFQAIEVYPAAGGPAVAVGSWTVPYNPQPAGSRLPPECALVLSHRIQTLRGVRPRGRTYIGPLELDANSGGVIASTAVTAMLNFAEAWHDLLVAEGMQPCVISADGTTKRGDVIAYSVDNAFDTQRRRGFDATATTARSV